ncbi:hypothetical protein pipiens_017185 [Culex pipiens pipiens]|uniref:Uncharacterized protein n=1 Tax=Culex pipiens pipiens TaxID=38569 RepID=A0ABD1CIY1_CULPP
MERPNNNPEHLRSFVCGPATGTHRPRKLKTMNLIALKRGKCAEKSGARHHRFIRIQRLLQAVQDRFQDKHLDQR